MGEPLNMMAAFRFLLCPLTRSWDHSQLEVETTRERKERFQQIGRLGASYQSGFIVPCSGEG